MRQELKSALPLNSSSDLLQLRAPCPILLVIQIELNMYFFFDIVTMKKRAANYILLVHAMMTIYICISLVWLNLG